DQPEGDDQVKYLLDSARALVDEEFRIAERLDAKGRNAAAAAGAFMAASQALAAAILTGRAHTATGVAAGIAILGIAAGSSFAAALTKTLGSWQLRREDQIPIEELRTAYLPHAMTGNPQVGRNLVEWTLLLAESRRKTNKARAENLETALMLHAITVGLAALEL